MPAVLSAVPAGIQTAPVPALCRRRSSDSKASRLSIKEQTQLKLEHGFHTKELVPLSKLSYFSEPQFLLLSMGMMVITLVEVRYDHT